jgi:hypothetical protein
MAKQLLATRAILRRKSSNLFDQRLSSFAYAVHYSRRHERYHFPKSGWTRIPNNCDDGLADIVAPSAPFQPFDLAFHPSEPFVYASLLTGEVKAFKYDEGNGETSRKWSVRPTKKCARSLVVQEDGSRVWAVGKAGGLL